MARKALHHWYGLYQALHPKIDSFEGEGGVYRFLRHEAEDSGYDEKVLKRMLKAGTFLDRLAGAGLALDGVKCGYAHVELLERLHQFSPAEAQHLLTDVLSNSITLKNLRLVVEENAAKGGQAQLAAKSKARSYVAQHQRATVELVQRMGTAFFGSPSGEFVLVKSFLSLRQFILINNKTSPIAIIPRVGDSSIKEWHAAEEILKTAMAVKNRLYRVWIVLPYESPIAAYLFAYAYRERAIDSWLFIATISKDGTGLQHYNDSATLLDLDLRGAGGGDWAGHSLADGRTIYGDLPLLSGAGVD
ncbi:hypothetical protein A264_04917 [Pseudomonas syringae pv. actinidiae ICMP 19071]|uniref:hypothetical protein n=1 Tax=Pseudomonas syringae TaxID=317 RepID=UPI000356E33A|nr:hypothetical protein [Pseudomonas syringae]EPM62084.1 hypothetical protein A264_04917 [Pseudomonas syringae pv. actinidiae ICMP 19071]EPM79864.1 hypothetical protein A3SO_04931 [Pseudomonas syringae pv. actinidiae ICMP 19072]OSN68405.1 hypothetical protein BV349_01091 [Pseudomonas syringae pv. actinidiae]OSN78558.1 hypothetical protein BV351_01175 [Pseudomonas syringae pv. actinidiae]RMS01299.1 hypothetical protein ALP75_200785 [Pseudomonas syringae pv. actinidiae]